MDARRTALGRDVAIAFAILVALYLIRYVRFQPIQIPAYLLIVSYDFVEVVFPFLTPYYPVGFPIYLYVLSVVSAAATRWLMNGEATWPRAVGGVSIVVGAISLLFAAFIGGPIVSSSDNPTPLLITGTTGIVLLGFAWWLLSDRSPVQAQRSDR